VIVFVAVDGHGEPRPVPAWIPRTREEKAWAAYAQRKMSLREGMESALKTSKARASGGKAR
jgi:acyl-CoA hydrolase